jgi:dTDP-D-glucose 4,6-dehydratase
MLAGKRQTVVIKIIIAMEFCFHNLLCSSIHGSGTRKKRYLYVDDVVRAFDIILHKGENGQCCNPRSCDTNELTSTSLLYLGEIYNIGTSLEVSPLEVARILLRKYGTC